jgi:psp operon transcriptional activator
VAAAEPAPAGAAPPAPADLPDPGKPYDLVDFLRRTEQDLLKKALEANAHHQKKTADFLGMTYHQLRNYLRKHKLIGQ